MITNQNIIILTSFMNLASLSTICHGITCVVPSPVFNPEAVLQAIEKEK